MQLRITQGTIPSPQVARRGKDRARGARMGTSKRARGAPNYGLGGAFQNLPRELSVELPMWPPNA